MNMTAALAALEDPTKATLLAATSRRPVKRASRRQR